MIHFPLEPFSIDHPTDDVILAHSGFNVNEIEAFTFNNCRLPSIPFSILLHRNPTSKPVPVSSGTSSSGERQLGSSAVRPQSGQSLKPNRQKHQNLVRKRRSKMEQMTSEDSIEASNLADHQRRATNSNKVASLLSPDEQVAPSATLNNRATATQANDSEIKSLTINLNTVVDQRTLISLLTGLDYLEELQLNYMQLNLTNFVLDLESDPSNHPASTAFADETSSTAHLSQPSASTSGGVASPTASTAQLAPPAGSSSSQTKQTSTISSIQTTSTTTLAPSTQLLVVASSSSKPAQSITALPPTTTTSKPSSSQMTTLAVKPTQLPTTTPAPLTTTTTAAPTTIRSRPPLRPVAVLSSSSSTKPPISLGAPRGLMIAQATGVPPTQQQSTTTTPAPQSTSVPSIPLATVVSQQNNLRQQQQNGNSNRSSPPPNGISVVGSSQSVSYTATSSNSPPRVQPTMFHLSGSSRQTLAPTTSSLISTSETMNPNRIHHSPSGWFQASSSAAHNDATLHNNNVAAGSRLSGSVATTNQDSLLQASSQPIEHQSVTPSSSLWSSSTTSGETTLQTAPNSPTSGFGIRTSQSGLVPVNLGTATYANSRSRSPSTSPTTSSATSETSSMPNLNVGLRGLMSNGQQFPTTSTSLNTLNPTTMNSFNSQQMRRQQQLTGVGNNNNNQQAATTATITLTTTPDAPNQFVAAGNRLNQFTNQPNPNPQRQTNHFVATTNSRGVTLVEDEINGGGNGQTTRRFKRAASSESFEEFELSFGELLPNLRSLKLESFIDLSHLSRDDHNQPKDARRSSSTNSGNQNRRFKRQFQPSDLPEKDESHLSDSESSVLSNQDDTLLAEESVHHNSVMMNSSGPTNRANNHDMINRNTTVNEEEDDNFEPGETLMRSASHHSEDSDWSVQPPIEHLSSTNEESLVNEEQQVNTPTTELNSAKARHLSLILVKLFSKLNKLRVLQLSSNNIPIWPDNVLFDSHSSLARLYLISNNIKQLERNSLANLTTLEALDLSSNQLRSLNGDLFRDLINMKNIRACRNLFRKLPPKLFAQLSNEKIVNSKQANKLESVDFSKNRYLSQLSADLFVSSVGASPKQVSNVAPIISLNLSDCAFNDKLAGKSAELLFATLPELISISLQGNKLRKILTTNSLFAKNNHLQKLDLSHNQLSLLSANLFNANASQLVELRLNHNLLTEIPDQFFFNLRKLRRLSLAHNRISQLHEKLFLTNQMIESLDLSYNQLITLSTQQSSMLPFGNGANLRYLNLAHNNLSKFEMDIFDIAWSFYSNLHTLDLSHNQFSGQISMPIFYTITDEMSLNLASNNIQSVNVDELMQHEQILDRYASYETNSKEKEGQTSGQQQQVKVPSVNIKLTGNPISCDCMLEPLISYSRRIAAATNPSLVASLFPRKPASQEDSILPSSSRYSVLESSSVNGGQSESIGTQNEALQSTLADKQPQLFYKFKFNDIYCAKPNNLHRRLLSHISIGDLLCPIKDERLCPSQCECHYQSAFKTAIVDCNNRQLDQIPDQLTDSSNFIRFDVESSFSPNESSNRSISSVDKIIIRLDNNRLTSMDQLSKLFRVVSETDNGEPSSTGEQRSRFARAPLSRTQHPSTNVVTSNGDSNEDDLPFDLPSSSSSEPLNPSSAQPLTSSSESVSTSSSGSSQNQKKVISPVMIGRNMHGTTLSSSRSRSRRQSGEGEIIMSDNESIIGGGGVDSTISTNHLDSMESHNSDQPPTTISTSVLESAEEFRNKRYPLTCELYLDHNLINSIPQSFLEALDQVRSSSMLSSLIPPQAALPTLMLESPIHTKINHLTVPNDSPSIVADPMKASSSTTSSALVDSLGSSGEVGNESQLFGRQPLAPEKKAALMETISQNVRLNQALHQRPGLLASEPRVSVSPSLVVLSLRYNNLSIVNAKMLQRLSKLIKSSNTKLYLGHNPFNCSDNYLPYVDQSSAATGGSQENMIPASPMGDQLVAASDSVSGAYLENADDLSPSASSQADSITSSSSINPLVPIDCPVGQLKTWLTRHHSSIGDLDELYCVHMTQELAEKLRLAQMNATSLTNGVESNSDRLKSIASPSSKWDHEHPWASSAMLSAMVNNTNASQVNKNGLSWNSELLAASAKLIDANMYDLCPYSGIQVLDASASNLLSAPHQQILISVAIVFILISLCLLLMLVYFGDTQTILAFIYIHMNPIYSCLHLNESHLDGEKLYDAFVSYSSADRDIVMELIEKLEQADFGLDNNQQQEELNVEQRQQQEKRANGMDKSHDTIVTEADLRPNLFSTDQNGNQNNNNLTSRRANSFQDLSTMSRSTSRIMLGDEFGGSVADVNGSPAGIRQQVNGKQQQQVGKACPYRLCIHERDWLPGHLISWNIVNSVQNSRRTILILSKEFIKSVWFQVEFHTAYYQMLEDKIDRLIVIVRGELPPKNELDKNLAFLLTTKTYLTWGERWFWERLHYALPHKQTLKSSVVVPIKQQPQHHHRYTQKPLNSPKNSNGNDSSSNTQMGNSKHHQKPLIMSSIGKDCSNLLLPIHHSNQQTGSSSSSSGSSSSSSNTRSFLSGSSTGNLLSPVANQTTTNDLLGGTTSVIAPTRLTIGGQQKPDSNNQTDPLQMTDSGRVTGLSSSSLMMSQQQSSGTGVTSIMLSPQQTQLGGANSKMRAKKEERLKSFVENSISSHLNLSEL